jgi:hypothetical protein
MQQSCLGADSTSGEKKYELTRRPSATTELTHIFDINATGAAFNYRPTSSTACLTRDQRK